MNAELLLEHYGRIAEAPDAIARLRRFILDLAVRGKLVEQDPHDEPASELLKRIADERARLVKAGAAQKGKDLPPALDDAEFELPQLWSWTRLGSIASYIQRGKSPKYAEVDGLPVVSQKCVQWSGLNLGVARLITRQSLDAYEKIRFLQNGDLLWNSTGTGTIGRIIKIEGVPENLVCDSHVTVVRCLEVSPEYVRTWLRSDYVYGVIEDRAAGSTNQVELTAQMAINQVVPLPPLNEQHRIVAKVDELMALCDQLETARAGREKQRKMLTLSTLAKLNEPDPETFADDARFALEHLEPLTKRTDQIKQLRQTILNLAVRGKLVARVAGEGSGSALLDSLRDVAPAQGRGRRAPSGGLLEPSEFYSDIPSHWSWARIHELGLTQTGTSPSSSNADLFGNFIPFVKPGDLDGASISYDGPGLSEEGVGHSRLAPAGTVMMVCIGATLGKVNVTDRDVCFNQQINSVTPHVRDIARFLAIAFKASGFQSLAWSKAGTGTLPIISKGKWEVLPVPLPPFAER
jgi:type I restriction enzyme S subunit